MSAARRRRARETKVDGAKPGEVWEISEGGRLPPGRVRVETRDGGEVQLLYFDREGGLVAASAAEMDDRRYFHLLSAN